ncbi:MAG: dATP/dGTP pyrophosphohydrolase domain-containing protein [Mariniphaga sp.]
MNELQKLINEIGQWSELTFSHQNSISKLHHLQKEVAELIHAIGQVLSEPDKKNEEVHHEFADCFILLLDAARKEGLSAKDILSAIVEKMEINKARKWGKPDENGVMEHIRDEHEGKTGLS